MDHGNTVPEYALIFKVDFNLSRMLFPYSSKNALQITSLIVNGELE